METTLREEREVYFLFKWSVLLKATISVVEMISGIAALFIPPAYIVSIAVFVLNYLPISSLQAILLEEVSAYTTGTVTFVAFYLFIRGFIKIFLLFALLKNRMWAYPASLLILGLFVLYQLYQILTTHSLIVVYITVFDCVVMYFIAREWRIAKKHQTDHTPLPT